MTERNKQASLVEYFKRAAKHAATLNPEVEISEAQERLRILINNYNVFEKVQDEIEGLCGNEEQLSLQHIVRNQVETLYYSAYGTLKTNVQSRTAENIQNPDTKSNLDSVKLPRINLMQFSGKYQDWASFQDLFVSLIHERTTLTGAQKLHYLKTNLAGEAAQLLKSFQITDANYAEAWKLLQSRYNNKRFIVDAHLKAFFAIPKCSTESTSGIKRVLDDTLEIHRALLSIGIPVREWDAILVHVITGKLDPETHRQWELSLKRDDLPTFDDITAFLETRYQSLEMVTTVKSKPSTITNPFKKSSTTVLHTFNSSCSNCSLSHELYKCPDYKKLTIDERVAWLREKKLCLNCLRTGHFASSCAYGSCKVCGKKHHSSLHRSEIAVPTSTERSPSTSAHFGNSLDDTQTLLATAQVYTFSSFGTKESLRALIDPGSQSTFISETVAQRLRLPRDTMKVSVCGLGSSTVGCTNGKVDLQISSIYDPTSSLDISALVLSRITKPLPVKQITKCKSWSHLKNLSLADPQFNIPSNIDLLIGSDFYGELLKEGLVKGKRGSPVAQNTIFGWVLSGPIISSKLIFTHLTVNNFLVTDNVDDQLRRFWEIEEISDGIDLRSTDERKCEEHFQSTYSRSSTGRYIVRLPFKPSISTLGSNRKTALTRLLQVERRLLKNPVLHQQYSDFLTEYQKLGHMVAAKSLSSDDNGNFHLPHHAVLKESSTTTKLRVVFDGSCKSSTGISLNETQFIGPKLQDDLAKILVRFRTNMVAFTADIAKMYRQVLVHDDDRDYQRILWREPGNSQLQEYQLCTVTYGTSSASYLAIKALQQLGIDEGHRYPIASKSIARDFYVDDLMSGAPDATIAIETQRQLTSLLQCGGFELRKWCSNSSEFLSSLSTSQADVPLEISDNSSIKTLGLHWSTKSDQFLFKVSLPPPIEPPTKRELLSDVARIFDPLGWLAPSIIVAKMMFQRLWSTGLSWDDPLPNDLANEWRIFRQNLTALDDVRVNRWLQTAPDTVLELHGFSDASELAYAAVVYARTTSANGAVTSTIVASKTKVAPTKRLSIPRLELCGALLLAKLMDHIVKTIGTSSTEIFLWTDSTIVLCWIHGTPSRWKTFVANRISQIQHMSSPVSWRHVPTADNPADSASRGLLPSQLPHFDLWWKGPSWLLGDRADWPAIPASIETSLELKRQTMTHLVTSDYELKDEFNLLRRYSSLSRLQRITAYCYRFYHNLKTIRNNRRHGFLTTNELDVALNCWILRVQAAEFGKEIKVCRLKQNLKGGPLLRLKPFLDENGILRVGGRLQHSELAYDMKHQIILPYKSSLTNLLVSEAHLRNLHAGPQLVLSTLRRKYWILDARRYIRHHVHKCIVCFRQKAVTPKQIMGDLPRDRLIPSRPFSKTGVDYAGPVTLRTFNGRGAKTYKAYIAVFVCMVTRAIHLEVVTDMTTNAFLAAYKRFTSRRGHCTDIFSDNGTNFVGAKREMSELLQNLRSKKHSDACSLAMSANGTNWHLIPPASPHFGGLWEAGVKSVKFHMRRIIGPVNLTYEEMSTTLTQIEACLNSRPLYPLTDLPDDFAVLTPGHFLIGTPLNAQPEPDFSTVKVSRLSRWQLVQSLYQHFWNQWSTEFLSRLQQRPKWMSKQPNVKIGSLVLVKDERLPPTKWLLGRITNTHPGKDGLVRVVTIKHAGGTFDRPITKICVLPMDEDNVI